MNDGALHPIAPLSRPRKSLGAKSLVSCALPIAVVVAAVISVACGGSTRSIDRAEHELLPTPTRGTFYPLEHPLTPPSEGELDQPDTFADFGQVRTTSEISVIGASGEEFIPDDEMIALLQKIESGQGTEADEDRLSELFESLVGGGGTNRASGNQVSGTVVQFSGDRLSIQPFPDPVDADSDDVDDSAEATPEDAEEATEVPEPEPRTVTITDDTAILVVRRLEVSSIEAGEEVSATAERTDEGRIRARTLSILEVEEGSAFAPREQSSGFGSARPSSFGTGRGRGNTTTTTSRDGSTTTTITTFTTIEVFGAPPGAAAPIIGSSVAGIPASGRVTKVEGNRLHVEATQGPLRITVDDDSLVAQAGTGARDDVRTGIAAVATVDAQGVALKLVIGPEDLLNVDESDRFTWLAP